jgi:hypothetical protein
MLLWTVWLEATVHGRQWFAGVEEGVAVLLQMLGERSRRKMEGNGMIRSWRGSGAAKEG